MRLAPRRAPEHALTSVLAVRWSSAHKLVKLRSTARAGRKGKGAGKKKKHVRDQLGSAGRGEAALKTSTDRVRLRSWHAKQQAPNKCTAILYMPLQ